MRAELSLQGFVSSEKNRFYPMFSATNLRKYIQTTKFSRYFLFLCSSQFLYVNGMLHLKPLQDRRFVKLLACAEFLNNASFFELALKLLEGFLDDLAFFYWYNNQLFLCF